MILIIDINICLLIRFISLILLNVKRSLVILCRIWSLIHSLFRCSHILLGWLVIYCLVCWTSILIYCTCRWTLISLINLWYCLISSIYNSSLIILSIICLIFCLWVLISLRTICLIHRTLICQVWYLDLPLCHISSIILSDIVHLSKVRINTGIIHYWLNNWSWDYGTGLICDRILEIIKSKWKWRARYALLLLRTESERLIRA